MLCLICVGSCVLYSRFWAGWRGLSRTLMAAIQQQRRQRWFHGGPTCASAGMLFRFCWISRRGTHFSRRLDEVACMNSQSLKHDFHVESRHERRQHWGSNHDDSLLQPPGIPNGRSQWFVLVQSLSVGNRSWPNNSHNARSQRHSLIKNQKTVKHQHMHNSLVNSEATTTQM